MSHLIKNELNEIIYYVCVNPLTEAYSIGEVAPGLQVETGLPSLFISPDKKEAYDLAFSEWSEDEDKNITGTLREYTFSVYEESESGELKQVLNDINSGENLKISSIDRPNSTDKLIMFSEYSFNHLPDLIKQKLSSYKSIKDGKRITKGEV